MAQAPSVQAHTEAWNLFTRRYDMVLPDWEARQIRYQRWYDLLLATASRNPTPYNAEVRSKYAHTQVMTFVDFLLAGLMPSWPWVHVEMPEPYRTNPLVALESAATEEINRRLRKRHFYRHERRWLRDAAMHGVGILKMPYSEGIGPIFRRPDPGNMAWDMNAENLREEASFVIERIDSMTYGQIKALWDQKKWTCSKAELESIKTDDIRDRARDEKYEKRISAGERACGLDDDMPVELHEMVTASRIITVARNSMVVLRDIPNPLGYIYYYDISVYPECREVQGYAIPELIEDIVENLNANLAQNIDNNSLISNAQALVSNSSGLNTFRLTNRPGQMLPVNDVERDFKWLMPPHIGPALIGERKELMGDGDNLLGIQQHTRGEAGKAGMKATVANILHANVNTRMSVEMNDANDYPLRVMFNDFSNLVMREPRPVWVPNDEWEAMRDVHAEGKMEIVPQAEAFVGNAMAKIQVLINALQAVGPRLGPGGFGAMLQEIVLLLGMRDPERVTRDLAGMIAQGEQQEAPQPVQTNEGEVTGVPRLQGLAQDTGPGASSGSPGSPM